MKILLEKRKKKHLYEKLTVTLLMSHVKFAAGLELYDVQLPYNASPTLYLVLFMSAIFGFVLGNSVD